MNPLTRLSAEVRVQPVCVDHEESW
jgi:hypothetical protein